MKTRVIMVYIFPRKLRGPGWQRQCKWDGLWGGKWHWHVKEYSDLCHNHNETGRQRQVNKKGKAALAQATFHRYMGGNMPGGRTNKMTGLRLNIIWFEKWAFRGKTRKSLLDVCIFAYSCRAFRSSGMTHIQLVYVVTPTPPIMQICWYVPLDLCPPHGQLFRVADSELSAQCIVFLLHEHLFALIL
jgi:hypothetical protein